MNGKTGSVGVGFQKVVTGVYAGYNFLKLACVTGKNNFFGFGMNGFMPEAFENPQNLFFENVSIL
jgi:hypothetical protein